MHAEHYIILLVYTPVVRPITNFFSFAHNKIVGERTERLADRASRNKLGCCRVNFMLKLFLRYTGIKRVPCVHLP